MGSLVRKLSAEILGVELNAKPATMSPLRYHPYRIHGMAHTSAPKLSTARRVSSAPTVLSPGSIKQRQTSKGLNVFFL